MKLRFLLALATLPVVLVGTNGNAAPPAYAGNMHNVCPASGICELRMLNLSLPREELPKRGIVFAFGGFFMSGASWEIVDFDHHTINSIATNLDRATETVSVVNKKSVDLNDTDLREIMALSDDLWRPKTPGPSGQRFDLCTDVVNDLILFDGDRALHYQSSCEPDGIAGDMKKWIRAQLGSPRTP